MMTLNTDEILDIAKHLDKRGSDGEITFGEFMASHGLEPVAVERVLKNLTKAGEGRINACRAGLILGLQIGAMRLDPVQWDRETYEREQPQCDCLICRIERGDL